MRCRRGRSRLQVIPPLQGGDNAALGTFFGSSAKLLGCPGIIAFIQAQRVDGQRNFTCQIAGATRALNQLPGNTAQGLTRYNVEPPLH